MISIKRLSVHPFPFAVSFPPVQLKTQNHAVCPSKSRQFSKNRKLYKNGQEFCDCSQLIKFSDTLEVEIWRKIFHFYLISAKNVTPRYWLSPWFPTLLLENLFIRKNIKKIIFFSHLPMDKLYVSLLQTRTPSFPAQIPEQTGTLYIFGIYIL